jgi:hypothetical protein
MKTSQLIAAAALSVLAAAGAAHAETYDGVHPLTTANSRDAVAVQGAAAARAGNVYGDGVNEGVTTIVSTADRAKVNFYRDTVPAAYNKPTVSFTRQAALK